MSIFRRTPRSRHTKGMSPILVGLIAIAAVVTFSYFAYTQANPFSDPYEFSATFETANNMKAGSPVRIAGVDVGKVSAGEPIGDDGAARVKMEISDAGLPIHRDAELKIRPRIFLEGNFFVDLQPGSPTEPTLEDGENIPIQQTAAPVQFADLLAALQSDTREDLQILLDQYAKGLEGEGARGLNEVYRYGEDAYRLSALANEATTGTEAHDLSRLVSGQAKAFRGLSRNEQALRDLVTNFNTFAGSLAREDEALAATIPALDDVLRVGQPALKSLNDSLPSVRAFARDALPGTRSSGPTIDANLPFIRQARRLMSERELKGLVSDLRPTIPSLAKLNEGQIGFQEQARALSACQENVLAPFAATPIPDPDFPENSGEPFYKQAPRGLVGLSGESRLSDTNSPLFHFNFGSGAHTIVQPGEDPVQKFVGTTAFPPIGVRPARPDDRPDFRPDVPCETQEAPNLHAPSGPADGILADPSPRPSAADKKLIADSEKAKDRLLQHLKDARAGRPTIDPLLYTKKGLEAAAESRGLKMLPDGRYVKSDAAKRKGER